LTSFILMQTISAMTRSTSHRGLLLGGVSILTVFLIVTYHEHGLANDVMTFVRVFLRPHLVLLITPRETSFTLLC